jgi:hypothetical protein
MSRTIFYEVAELTEPTAEPFMVVRINVEERKEGGVEGTIQSLHWTREQAQQSADALTENGVACAVCGGSGFSGHGSGYGDVCGECGGLRCFP